MTDHSGCYFPPAFKKKQKNKAIIQNPSLPGGWTAEMSLWYSLGLHTVITDKPRTPSEGGLEHVGFNAYSKSHLMILAAFFHQSHHPLLFLFLYYSTFRSPFLYLAQMSDKAWELERFSKSPTTIHLHRWVGTLKTNMKSSGVPCLIVDFWRWDASKYQYQDQHWFLG